MEYWSIGVMGPEITHQYSNTPSLHAGEESTHVR